MKRRVISLLLTLAMCFSLVVGVSAADNGLLSVTGAAGATTLTVANNGMSDGSGTGTVYLKSPSAPEHSYSGGGSGTAGVNSSAAGDSTTPTPSTAPTGDNNANGGVGGFSDVKSGDYFAASVLWALNNNVTNGIGAGKFGPEAPCTRAQMVTFLWRAAGSPAAEATSAFKDVASDAYYAKAVAWAVANGITNGKGDNQFQPNTNVNRAMSVTFLYRAYGNK